MKTNENISPEIIKAYLEGTLSHAQTHEFEKAMLNDAVLRDVVEGYEISRDENIDFQKINTLLSARLKSRVGEEQKEIYPLWRRVPLYARAASVLLFLGIGIYFLTKNNDIESTEKIASVQPSESKNQPQLAPPIIVENEPIAQGNSVISTQKMKAEMDKVKSDKVVTYEQKKVEEASRGGVKMDTIISMGDADVETEKKSEVTDKEVVAKSKAVEKPQPTAAYETQSSQASARTPVMKREEVYARSKVITSESQNSNPESSKSNAKSKIVTLKIWNEEYLEYLRINLKKPKKAIENQIVGEVEVEFEINKIGEPSDFKITKSLGYGCDEEAIRLIKEGPKWLPKTYGGNTGRQRVRQVVNF